MHLNFGSLERTISAALAEVGVQLWHELVDRIQAAARAVHRRGL